MGCAQPDCERPPFHLLYDVRAGRDAVANRLADATTVWLVHEKLVKAKVIDKVFARLDMALTERSYLAIGA